MAQEPVINEDEKERIALEYLEIQKSIKDRKKLDRKEKEILEINQAIDSMNFTTKRDRVAGLLNMYPQCRNSDLSLTIKYWEVFQSEIYEKNTNVSTANLFKLERLTTIARLRAKIQNEYGLFLGSEEIRNKRRQREEEVREEVLADNAPPPILQIFADESGKNADTVIVGSVWFLDMRKAASFQNLINGFKNSRNYKNEFHFSAFNRNQLQLYKDYIDLVSQHRDFITFKAIATPRRGVRRDIAEIVNKLYQLLITKGFRAEVESGRVALPRQLTLTIDKAEGLDAISKEEITADLSLKLTREHGEGSTFTRIAEIDSKESAAVQLADLVSGALNRRMNLADQDGIKTELADYIIERLGLLDPAIDAFELINLD